MPEENLPEENLSEENLPEEDLPEENLSKENIYRHTAWLFDVEHGVTPPLPDLPFYLDYAKQYCGEKGEKGEILELGCGTGRVALVLGTEGFHITGLDLSRQMLDIFCEKLAKASPDQPEIRQRISIVHANMADFSLGRKFALITAPFRAFQAITDRKDIENTLACVRRHLTDEGIFIVNVFNPYADPLDESWRREEVFVREIHDPKTGACIGCYECRARIDTENQILYPYLAYNVSYPDGRRERLEEPLQLKYYYSRQLRAEVEKAGLAIEEEYSWYDKSPPGGREIILICRKGA